MEKEFNFDQEIIRVTVADDMFSEEPEDNYSDLSEEDYTVADESNIEWENL